MPELASWPSIPTPLFSDAASGSDFTYAMPVGIPEWDVPISATTKAYVFRQWMMQRAVNYAPLALNTAYPNAASVFNGYILVGEGPRQDLGGGNLRWQRIWAKVPDTHNEWEMFVYSFIGYYLAVGSPATIITANPRPIPSKSRIQHDYFMVGGAASITDPITGTVYGSGISSPGVIDKIWAMQYVAQATIGGATYGGIILPVTQLQPSTSSIKTWPVSDDYQTNCVSDALQNSWAASTVSLIVLNATNTLSGGPPATSGHMAGTINTGSSVQGGQLPAEDSRLDRWMGNIFLRRTRYVLAQ